jgi:hypothetical protein
MIRKFFHLGAKEMKFIYYILGRFVYILRCVVKFLIKILGGWNEKNSDFET